MTYSTDEIARATRSSAGIRAYATGNMAVFDGIVRANRDQDSKNEVVRLLVRGGYVGKKGLAAFERIPLSVRQDPHLSQNKAWIRKNLKNHPRYVEVLKQLES